MTTNPLKVQQPQFDPIQRLHDHVAALNNHNWVRNSGKLYFVNQRTLADGKIQHFVDRTA